MLFFLQKGLSGLVDVACADGQDQVTLLRSPAEIGRDLRERLKVDAAGMQRARSREEMPMVLLSRAA